MWYVHFYKSSTNSYYILKMDFLPPTSKNSSFHTSHLQLSMHRVYAQPVELKKWMPDKASTRTARAGEQGVALLEKTFVLPREFCPPQNIAPKNKKRRNNASIPKNPKKSAKIPKNLKKIANSNEFSTLFWNMALFAFLPIFMYLGAISWIF